MDFIHSEKIGDALIARMDDTDLKTLAFGDFHEYVVRGASILDDCPAIFIIPLSITENAPTGGLGQVMGTAEKFRITMVREFGTTTVARDKAQHMKALVAALFTWPRLEIDGMEVVKLQFVSAIYSDPIIDAMLQPLWAISVEVEITCRTGGQ